jgi:transcriptional regulator with XRE-family HTH domain
VSKPANIAPEPTILPPPTPNRARVAKKTMGAVLREARENAGMTQKQLADRADMSVPVISRLERGDSDPRVSTVRRIADATGASLDAIINGTAVPAPRAKRAPQNLRAEIRAARREIAAALKRLDAIEAGIAPKRRPGAR